MKEYEKLEPVQKLFSEIPVNGVFLPFPPGTKGRRLIKILPVENPQFGLINCLNFAWLLDDCTRRPAIELENRMNQVSQFPTFGGYVNYISKDCECTYLGQVNL